MNPPTPHTPAEMRGNSAAICGNHPTITHTPTDQPQPPLRSDSAVSAVSAAQPRHLLPGDPPRQLDGADTDLEFFLGSHEPGWLHSNTVPLFVSDRRLRRYKRLPVAAGSWALDSGGFTELATFGDWTHGPTPSAYAAQVRRYRDEIGRMAWAAPQDWMFTRPPDRCQIEWRISTGWLMSLVVGLQEMPPPNCLHPTRVSRS